MQKANLRGCWGLSLAAVRVTNPDVGGGFGMKFDCYPEYVPIAQAARMLGSRWLGGDAGGIDPVRQRRARSGGCGGTGFDENIRLTAYRCTVRANLGAYNSMFAQLIHSVLFSRVLTGAYDIPAAHLVSDGFLHQHHARRRLSRARGGPRRS